MGADLHYRPDIDGLRAVAVVCVLLFHAGAYGVGGGYVGVDIFFVISGYLITSIILRDINGGSFSIAEFYARRIRRLFPALFCVLICTTAAAGLLLLPRDFLNYGRSLAAATLFASNVFFRGDTGYFAAPAEDKPLLHTWSLAVEEQFYLTFPIFLLLVARMLKRRWIACTLLIALLALATSIARTATDQPAAFYLVQYRAWELLIGALLAMELVPPLANRIVREACSLLGLGLIGWTIFTYSPTTAFPGLSAVPPCLAAALLIHCGASGPTLVNWALSRKPYVFIGLIAYPLYLWHWPILVFARHWVARELAPLEAAFCLAAAFAAAVLTWRFVETPVRRVRWPAPVLISRGSVAMAISVVIATAITLSGGWPARWPTELATIAAGASDHNPRRAECANRTPEQVATEALCRIGAADQAPSFAVLGDSHATALWPGIALKAQQFGRNGVILTRDGCRPLMGVHKIGDGNQDRRCDAFYASALRYLLAHPEIGLVFLVGRWGIQANGGGYKTEQAFWVDDWSGAPSVEENARTFARGLERLLDALHGHKVVVVSSVPEHSFDAPSATAIARRFSRPEPKTPIDDFFARQRFVMSEFERHVRERGIAVLHPWRMLCDGRYCNYHKDGRSLYLDDDHLSQFGALAISPLFEQIFLTTRVAGPG
jgi:peptidoglycan/LPS O-acetylase OafA/YrhL